MIALTVQTDLFQRFRLWKESAAPIRSILHFQSEHSERNSANVYLIEGNYSSAIAYIDPELRRGPFLIRDGEKAVECGKLLGSQLFKVNKNNDVIPVPR
jgi:hypothetical protein